MAYQICYTSVAPVPRGPLTPIFLFRCSLDPCSLLLLDLRLRLLRLLLLSRSLTSPPLVPLHVVAPAQYTSTPSRFTLNQSGWAQLHSLLCSSFCMPSTTPTEMVALTAENSPIYVMSLGTLSHPVPILLLADITLQTSFSSFVTLFALWPTAPLFSPGRYLLLRQVPSFSGRG